MENYDQNLDQLDFDKKSRELEIELKILKVKEKEEAIKKLAKKKEKLLTSPFALTIMTVLGGLLGTAVGAVLQGYWSTQLERQKFESELIQKVLDKHDEAEIKKSLLFYIDIGLIKSIDKDSLRDIVNDEPNRLPYFKADGPKGETVNYKVNKNGEITFINGWDSTFIKRIFIPQLTKIKLFGTEKFNGNVSVYEPAAQDFKNAFEEIEQKGKLNLIKSWDGCYSARVIRGSSSLLSEHALGIAFDINAKWNIQGRKPAEAGSEGSLMELIPILKKHGFEWGGERKLPDAMHFVWVGFKQK